MQAIFHMFIYICQVGKGRGMGKVNMWSDKIVNHFWYSCQVSGGEVEALKVIRLCTILNLLHFGQYGDHTALSVFLITGALHVHSYAHCYFSVFSTSNK